jgi:hypothetical protein
MEAIIYYRKHPETWMATSPFNPPPIRSFDELEEVHRMDVDQLTNASTGTYFLEVVWERMNHHSIPALRSMMVGDIVIVGDKGWQVESTGWSSICSDWMGKSWTYGKPVMADRHP